MYFTLKDETAAIKTVMFRGHASRALFQAEMDVCDCQWFRFAL